MKKKEMKKRLVCARCGKTNIRFYYPANAFLCKKCIKKYNEEINI